ncbi:hypothetical protein [Bifidobacterium vespertilionis]|uniref:Uncharacterized protein n=1 Tax=Bifidobacterium vespertilionis TaxID=2562524 RepID=A0A5J5DSX3_9BIFI|nr:hypothetical protein [Bifidobacterium vespertilionis]KAA8817016.1 hypothetical protein EMO90_10840 [Bifidobacterium vespertilionis]KAA8823788.1 hypothetical protein EM848_04465 [Bifidobacterium vespertilionis]MBT1179252.1 hypothetical protein [Bifidobacterium vespertilionis]
MTTTSHTLSAAAITAAIILLLTALVVLDVLLLNMSAGAVFGSCLTLLALVAGYRFRARWRR